MKFKKNNQICSSLKISQSINAESHVIEITELFDVEKGKKQKIAKMFFLKLLLKMFCYNMEMLFMADLLTNGLHEKVIICSICYITKSRLNIQFAKKIPLEKFNR